MSGPDFEDEQTIINDEKRTESEKKEILQRAWNMAASNGDVDKVNKLLSGNARSYIELDAPDEDGTPPLIYASCFVCCHREGRHSGRKLIAPIGP